MNSVGLGFLMVLYLIGMLCMGWIFEIQHNYSVRVARLERRERACPSPNIWYRVNDHEEVCLTLPTPEVER